jgi:RND family efflux transporter MFP subunit
MMKQFFRFLCLSGAAAGLFLGGVGKLHATEFVGLVHPVADVKFGVAVAGVIHKLHVKPGHVVNEGQAFVELDSSTQKLELERRVLIARDSSELEASQARLKVLDELLTIAETVASRSQAVSREELLKLRLEHLSARGRLEQLVAQKNRERVEVQLAQVELDLRTVRAPRAGTVVEVEVDEGAWVKPGDPLFRLVDTGQVELRLNLPLRVAGALRAGVRLRASFESAGRDPVLAEGVVQFVSPLADNASGLVDVRAVFANPKGLIRPGVKGRLLGAPLRSTP